MTCLGKYELHEKLGRGGFGTVYRALDTSLGRDVAVKILHPQLMVDDTFVERFKKEARVLAALDHPNIVTIHEMGELDGRVFIAMKYLSGGSLQSRIQKEGVITFEEAKHIMGQVCDGLQVAHEQGMVHRDLKPANILFDQRGNAVISDFGLARVTQMSASSSSLGIVGTPAYRAPELWRGKPPATPATDVYSLGCIFYEMLTGKVLFDAETPDEIIAQHLIDGPNLAEESNAIMDAAKRSFILQALDKDMGKRPESAHRFHTGLIESMKGQVTKEKKPKQEKTNVKVIAQKIVTNGEPDLMKVELAPGIEMEFVRIPAGEFLMGSDPVIDHHTQADEIPQQAVYVDEYWIGKFPVTNEQFHLSSIKRTILIELKRIGKNNDNHPIVDVSWHEAKEFCAWLSKKAKKKIGLPTEAQWEKAARGVNGSIYPWDSGSEDHRLANFGNENKGTTPVGFYTKGISPFGIYDAAGNVFEWTNDWYDENYYKNQIIDNPRGLKRGSDKSIRGGSFRDVANEIRCAYRDRCDPSERDIDLGFRCVINEK